MTVVKKNLYEEKKIGNTDKSFIWNIEMQWSL
jgi:hypothetical protein